MPEIEARPGEEKLLILPLGEESKKITQVISNDTARKIIELLADAPLSTSDIADRLQTPLTTIVYNLENLESVGLIRVEKIKYSEKGREVKIFAPVRKLIVVVPEKTDRKSITDILRKYVGVFLAAVFASTLIEFFLYRTGAPPEAMKFITYETTIASDNMSIAPEAANTSAQTVMTGLNQTMNATVQPAITSTPAPVAAPLIQDGGAVSQAAPDIITNIADMISKHPGILFLIGCLFVIIMLLIWDIRRRKKNGNM